jgi:hypothetical protein
LELLEWVGASQDSVLSGLLEKFKIEKKQRNIPNNSMELSLS